MKYKSDVDFENYKQMKKFIYFTVLLITVNSFYCVSQNYKNYSSEEFRNMILGNSYDTEILDVRTAAECDSGYIEGALNIDFYNTDFKNLLSKLDKNKTYLVYCRVGRRSGLTCNTLNELGFTKLYNLKGGIKEWRAAGFSTVK
ncbi:MAG: rhodanese-like domain-containing protein [Ignavibacteria bacterium]|nr:rhodanese-like domain-containing protein [Ignavibacteria bacterium]